MPKIIVIYAHPQTAGHCSLALAECESRLRAAAAAEYEVLDLYQAGYEPRLLAAEHYTAGNKLIAPENLAWQEKIKASRALLLIYPVWWGSMPAVLKGFFDRVLTPGFGYRFRGPIPQKLLKGKRAAVIMTSGGPRWYYFFTGNRPKRLIKKDILGFCGLKARVWQIGNCRRMTEFRQKIIKRAAAAAVKFLLA